MGTHDMSKVCLEWSDLTLTLMRPLLDKKLFPVHRPGGLKRAGWDFYFFQFKKKEIPIFLIFFFTSLFNLRMAWVEKLKVGKKETGFS